MALRRWLVLATIAGLLVSLVPLTAQVALAAGPFTVNTFNDPDPALLPAACASATPGECSLRRAIREANVAGGATTINLPPGTYALTRNGTGDDAALTGDLDIANGANITILGIGVGAKIIDGDSAGGGGDRVFDMRSGGTLTIGAAGDPASGITIRNGVTTGDGGGIRAAGTGALTLNHVTVEGNSAGGNGGGIYLEGAATLTVTNSTITGNSASNDGGGIHTNSTNSTLSVTDSTISGNTASSSGGGLRTFGTVTIVRSTISGNRADGEALLFGGGGIYHGMLFSNKALTLTNSTISGNVIPGGRPGGGLRIAAGTVTLTNSTVAANSTGIYPATGTTTVRNSIIANSTGGANCEGTIVNGGNNIDSGSSCGFGVPNSNLDPQLGPLSVNQPGLTATHAPDPSSVAVGRVPTADANCTGTDQRGVPRPQGANCDAGAYEVLPAPTITGVLPVSGTTSGGTLITITGTGFQSNATVTVDGNPCATTIVSGGTTINAAMIGGTTITCLTPPGTAGGKNVVVTNPDGQATVVPGTYTYVAPTITSITPNSGPSNGGTPVTIVGTGFQPNATVTIGVAPCQMPVTNGAGTEITCTTPAGPAGTADVVVTNPGAPGTEGTAVLIAGFSYLSPSQASFSPASVAFGNQQINTTSAPQVITLTNTGTTVLNVSAVALSGGNAADFAIVPGTDTCTGAALAFNANCTVSVTFTPTATQARGAALTFTDDSNGVAGSQQNIVLSGTGTPTPLPNFTVTVSKSGPGEVQPGTGALVYQQGANAALTAVPNAGAVLLGWTVDGVFVGFGNPLTFPVTKNRTVVATFATRATFSDVLNGDGNYEAITQLATRGIINPAGVNGSGRFEPNRGIVRAESAGLIARAFGWNTEQRDNPFPDRCDVQGQNCIDAELWNNVAALSFHNVAFGYPGAPTCEGAGTTAPCYLPRNPVLNVQLISFITRAFNEQGAWQKPATDTPALYPNVPGVSGHRLDLIAYVANAGAVPGQPTTGPFTGYDQPASRRFSAAALWQAMNAYYSVNRVP